MCKCAASVLVRGSNKFDATTISKYTYANDAGGRRTSVKTTGTAFMTVGDMFNLYNYNTRSELIGANRYFGDDLEDTGDPVGLQSFGYAYDPTSPLGELRRTGIIGNRTSVTNSGDVTSYSPNNLNQYTQRQISDLINLRGSAETGATVTVKMGSSQSESVTRQDKYWHKQLTSTNDTEAQYPLIKVVGVAKILLRTWVTPAGQDAATNGDDIVTIETGHVFVAKTPEQFTYDEDGNLLSDGRWEYTWNGENRLVSMETATNKVGTTVPVVRLEFVYDFMGRRISKTVYEWESTNWVEQCESTFLYDGFNLVSETTVESGATNVSFFVFGLDLSGSLQGAGGVGGLLAEIDDGEAYFPCFDANGNISEYVSTNGTIVAHREYSPYGKTLVSSGTKKSDFTHWFSTKPFDQRSGLYSCIFRYYDPDLGRWPSRDPIGERGGLNVYAFVANSALSKSDYLGRLELSYVHSAPPHASVELKYARGGMESVAVDPGKETPNPAYAAWGQVKYLYAFSGNAGSMSVFGTSDSKGGMGATSLPIHSVQMSIAVGGTVTVEGCCISGQAEVAWSASAASGGTGAADAKAQGGGARSWNGGSDQQSGTFTISMKGKTGSFRIEAGANSWDVFGSYADWGKEMSWGSASVSVTVTCVGDVIVVL